MSILRVLIVDDHALTRANLRAILVSAFHICGEAKDGNEAVQKVRELKPDVVVLDIFMPGMNGMAAAQAIKELSPSTKIIFISLHLSARDEMLTARLLGASAFVPKTQAAFDLIPAIKKLSGETPD